MGSGDANQGGRCVMASKARIGIVWLAAAVAGVAAATAGRAETPCCEFPCRLLDPLGQDPLWTGRTDALLLWRDAPQCPDAEA